MCPASTIRPPSVSRALSSMSAAPTMRAYSTARSAATTASGPGSWSIDQFAAMASTSACTWEGGRPRTSSWAMPSSRQPSPRPWAWTSRERCVQNQAARCGSGRSRHARARLLLLLQQAQRPLGDLQGAFRSPHRRPATAASPSGRDSAGARWRGRSRRAGRPRCSRPGAGWRGPRRGRNPTAPSRVPGASVARSRRDGGGPRRRRPARRAGPWRDRGRGTSSWPGASRARRRAPAWGRRPGPRRSGG